MDYIENDLNMSRAMRDLERMEDPGFLIIFWRAIGLWQSSDIPSVEKHHPWWDGLEDLITRH